MQSQPQPQPQPQPQKQQQAWLSKDHNEEESSSSSAPPVRKRTRATADQLSVLEDTFAVNVSPNSKLRKQLAEQLQMSERSIQIWFQNRRAKVKHMQKRAQMQMHQASIRAQLYQYHQQQQQQQPYGHHQPLLPMQPYQHPYYYNRLAGPPARAQSVDAVQHHHYNNRPQPQPQDMLFTPASSVPPVPQYYPNWMPLQDDMPLSRQSMPPQVYPYQFNHGIDPSLTGLDFPEYIHGQVSPSPSPLHQKSNSAIPTLVSVPDAGPTAILATANSPSSPPRTSSYSSSSPDAALQQQQPAVSTIDPSNLMMNSPTPEKETNSPTAEILAEDEEPKDLYLSATTLTIGTWHRLKMHETDLVCVYRPDTRTFAWHIVDGGCHFKMEVAQHAVSSIEMVLDEHEALADVHFDISEPPLFYMESTTTPIVVTDDKKKMKKSATEEPQPSPMWVQCSDFTEGKQASRFFRHTLKGVAHHMKQELLTLINNHEETRRLVQFIEPQYTQPPPPPAPAPVASSQSYLAPLLEPQQQQQDQLLMQAAAAAGFVNPNMYWSNQEPIPCELYMS